MLLCIRQHHAVWFWSCSDSASVKWIFRFLRFALPLSRRIFFFLSFPFLLCTFIIYSYNVYAYASTFPYDTHLSEWGGETLFVVCRPYSVHLPVWLNDFLANGNRLYIYMYSLIHSPMRFLAQFIHYYRIVFTTWRKPPSINGPTAIVIIMISTSNMRKDQ